MPTTPGTQVNQATNPQQTLDKVSSLITELDAEVPETPAVPAEPSPPVPAPPPESADTDAEHYEVKVDGEAVIVDLDELKSGYSRDADYRKKTMALAEERRAFEADQQAIQAERQQYQQGLSQIRQALQQLQGEPDWDTLHKELPPDQFLARKADWEHQKLNLDRLRAAEQEVLEKQQADQYQRQQQYLRAEQDKLRAAIPEWSEPDIAKAEQARIISTAKAYGYTEQEVLSVVDHRAIQVLRDAMRYRELHREPTPAVKAKVSAIKPAKPGTPERPRPNERQQQLIAQTRSGRQRDAMKAIESMLPDD